MKSKSHLIALFLLTGVILALIFQVIAPAKQKTKLDYEKLVADLVSHNPEPTFSDGIVFAKDYDWNDVARVEKVLQTIIDNFDDAWPTLVKHANDEEYSFAAHIEFDDSYNRNYSVGDVCKTLLRENITNVAMKLRTDLVEWKTLRRARFILDTEEDPNKLQNWFKEQIRKQRKFYELQIEYAESAIGFIPQKYFEDANTKDHVLHAVSDFKKEIEKVKAKKEPILMKRFTIHDGGRYIIKK